jgi:glycosyltransferase involved in cell wall biosynthesis
MIARARLGQRIGHATDLAARAWHLVDHLSRRSADHAARIEYLERLASIRTTMGWIEQARVPEDDLVSVVTVTRNRSDLLAEALASLRAQHYTNWELILIDDASEPEHHDALIEMAARDDRIVEVEHSGKGLAAGRNVGRRAASGGFITYLDDDNLMDPLWLKAVVWGFGQRPDVDVFCGARLIDDIDRARGLPAGGGPFIQFEEIDAAVLEKRMQSDIGSIAHRASVDTRSDERFARSDDWDWLARATRSFPYATLPCIAQTYRTSAASRLSEGATAPGDSG